MTQPASASMPEPSAANAAGRRIAFFGGSFDPPHLGHLAVARAARDALALDTVLFAPVGTQPLKPNGASASFEGRLAMTRLAIAGETGFELSLLDAPTASGAPSTSGAPALTPNYTPNYTIDTLRRLHSALPPEAELFCLIGADSFVGLRNWHRAAEIPFAAPLIVASRPGQPLTDLEAALPPGLSLDPAPEMAADREQFPAGQRAGRGSGIEVREFSIVDGTGRRARFYLLPGIHVEISASEIRQAIRAASTGWPCDAGAGPMAAVLPAAVSAYIASHKLYR